MEVFCTSVIPVKFHDAKSLKLFIGECSAQGFLKDYAGYAGELNLKTIRDINTNGLRFYYIDSEKTDIQCAFGDMTLTLILTWKNTYEDYYELVNHSLRKKKKLVRRVLEYDPKDENLVPFIGILEKYKASGACFNYAFTFYSIFDDGYSPECERHLKVLAEPSIINMDDMVSSNAGSAVYDADTRINGEILKTIGNIDFYSEQLTFVTWSTIVSLSKSRESFQQNHKTMILLEVMIQRIWNLCYSQNNELNECITNIGTSSADVSPVIISTYRILIETKSCISATYSGRLSRLYQAIIDSSQLQKNASDLEQKLNYLIIFTNSINQSKNKNIQVSSEILLFLIAVSQVIPIFFNLPVITHQLISFGSVVLLCVLGVILIRIKNRL